jgi:hypothetical protein
MFDTTIEHPKSCINQYFREDELPFMRSGILRTSDTPQTYISQLGVAISAGDPGALASEPISQPAVYYFHTASTTLSSPHDDFYPTHGRDFGAKPRPTHGFR